MHWLEYIGNKKVHGNCCTDCWDVPSNTSANQQVDKHLMHTRGTQGMIPSILCAEQALVRWTRSAYSLSSCVHWIHHEPMVHTEFLPDYSQMWPYLRKGPISGQCKCGYGRKCAKSTFHRPKCDHISEKGPFRDNVNVGMGENAQNWHFTRSHGLLHHQDLWCIPYLLAKLETRTTFLHLKQGPNSFTPRLSCSCTDYTGNGTWTVYGNVYGDKTHH